MFLGSIRDGDMPSTAPTPATIPLTYGDVFKQTERRNTPAELVDVANTDCLLKSTFCRGLNECKGDPCA